MVKGIWGYARILYDYYVSITPMPWGALQVLCGDCSGTVQIEYIYYRLPCRGACKCHRGVTRRSYVCGAQVSYRCYVSLK